MLQTDMTSVTQRGKLCTCLPSTWSNNKIQKIQNIEVEKGRENIERDKRRGEGRGEGLITYKSMSKTNRADAPGCDSFGCAHGSAVQDRAVGRPGLEVQGKQCALGHISILSFCKTDVSLKKY